MNEMLYEMIFKRKSFHLFRNLGEGRISQAELQDIQAFWQSLTPLCPQIKTAIQIVPGSETTNQHGQEYCIAFYSEKKEGYLQNIGYLGQLLELYLVSKDIATCWYGIGKAKQTTHRGLQYVIMIAMSKVDDPTRFRKDLFKAKRKPVEETWQGEPIAGVTEIARFAPSACNSQPWRVVREEDVLKIYRYKKPTKIGIMSPEHARYFNRIDMGIYLCILELCLKHEKLPHAMRLRPDLGSDAELTLSATVALS